MDEITRNAPVIKFEKTIAKFFGAPYGVAVDCCTNALELCFRLDQKQRGKAVVIAKGVCILAEVNHQVIKKRKEQGWIDEVFSDLSF